MSALTDLPDNVQEVGSVNISIFLGEDGLGYAYGVEGVEREAAVGYLLVVADKIRQDAVMDWPEDWPEDEELEDDEPC